MRLLIAAGAPALANGVRDWLYRDDARWCVDVAPDGLDALDRLARENYDLLLLDGDLPGANGFFVLDALRDRQPCCPPRVLFLCEPERRGDAHADAVAPPQITARQAASLLKTLLRKPVPALALPRRAQMAARTEAMLDALRMPRQLNGYRYAAWLVTRLALSPLWESQPIGAQYADCAAACRTTPAAVERCLRIAVEYVFTRGDLAGIERFFGATVDAERGKPTNRAFLLQAAQQARLAYSRTAARLPNSIDTHQSPAAPTTV